MWMCVAKWAATSCPSCWLTWLASWPVLLKERVQPGMGQGFVPAVPEVEAAEVAEEAGEGGREEGREEGRLRERDGGRRGRVVRLELVGSVGGGGVGTAGARLAWSVLEPAVSAGGDGGCEGGGGVCGGCWKVCVGMNSDRGGGRPCPAKP